ncbi:MAG: hypothetical protein FJY76_00070 [Candidatus Aenigmarchaeota archaeon]|nr:hypothetical protein [Candidatus Aenigmarchaeota archaeon]
MLPKDIRRIMEEDARFIEAFDTYDRTGVFPFKKTRIDLSLRSETIEKLREVAKKKKTSMSAVIDQMMLCFG